jgi:hypothetical protein
MAVWVWEGGSAEREASRELVAPVARRSCLCLVGKR